MATDAKLCVAFIWHMHQPHYREPLGTQYTMPWVRFHAVKDYLDMLLVLERFPGLRQTFNLVPVLIEQLQDYAAGRAEDRIMRLTRKYVADLAFTEKVEILGQFFELNWDCLVKPHPRYRELLNTRQELHLAGQSGEQMVAAFSDQDFEDLMMWYNLAWVDPLFVASDPELGRWVARGRGFTYQDRQQLLEKHLEITRKVLPAYRRLQEAGQIEVTTTPYAHPILPLLLDSDSARRARPRLPYPRARAQWPGDAAEHLDRALACHRELFGADPAGLWAAEQAVSPELLPLLAERGLRWTVSDEGVLGWSLERPLARDGNGLLREPEVLYRPYRLPDPAGETAIVFRDISLSDLIGFQYGQGSQRDAARDLHRRLATIRERCPRLPDGAPPLVTIALDGENCWEHYPGDGHEFLQEFYARCAADPDLEMVTVGDYVRRHPPTETLPRLHSGSWIYADYSTWIGEPSKNRAWELLAAARQAYAAAQEGLEPAARERGRYHLLLAEGSDWFWWFGEGHAAAHKPVFDRLFRHHLQAIYQAISWPAPPALQQPVRPATGTGPLGWLASRSLELAGASGTMHQGSRHLERLRAGYDADGHLHLRVTFTPRARPDSSQHLLLGLFYPGTTRPNSRLRLPAQVEPPGALGYLFGHAVEVVDHGEQLEAWLEEAGPDHGWRPRGLVDAGLADQEGREWDVTIPLALLGLDGRQAVAAVACLVEHATLRDYTTEPLHLPPRYPG